MTYLAPRDDRFKGLVSEILSKGNIEKKYTDILTSSKNLAVFHKVFTDSSIDGSNNYEFFEFLGDEVVNKAIVWYLPKRFDFLRGAKGANIIPRLRISLGSRENLAAWAERLGMWTMISASLERRNADKKKMLEDVFEAFFGATEWILDRETVQGVGYEVCYRILSGILDSYSTPIRYEDLFDPKTRLLQFFQQHKDLGVIKYHNTTRDNQSTTKITMTNPSKPGEVYTLANTTQYGANTSERAASEIAIAQLERMGIVIPKDERYVI
jgi:dsRNA-specific ribonuclease